MICCCNAYAVYSFQCSCIAGAASTSAFSCIALVESVHMISMSVVLIGEEEDAERFTCKVKVIRPGGQASRKAPPANLRAPAQSAITVFNVNDKSIVQGFSSSGEDDVWSFYFCIEIERNDGLEGRVISCSIERHG